MKWIIRLLVSAIAVFVAAHLIPGIEVSGYGGALKAAIILGLLNLFVRPIIMLFALPLNFLTLGLFSLVINGFLFWLAGNLLPGFQVHHFVAAFLGALIVAIVNSFVRRG